MGFNPFDLTTPKARRAAELARELFTARVRGTVEGDPAVFANAFVAVLDEVGDDGEALVALLVAQAKLAAGGPEYAARHLVDVASATEAEMGEAVLAATRDIVEADARRGPTF
jgi:hypothetical protein